MATKITDARARTIARKMEAVMKSCKKAEEAFNRCAVANAAARAKLMEFQLILERSGLVKTSGIAEMTEADDRNAAEPIDRTEA